MFKEKRDGLCYVGSNNKEYELFEGMTSNDYKSDIVFIMDRNDTNDGINPGVVIDFVYGGFRHLDMDYIKETIEKYIEDKEIEVL